MDTVDTATRSKMMSSIRGKDTGPEMVVRRFLHGQGYRYRIHRKDLPGKPDIVIPRLKVCIFVHGCFWHRHPGCPFATNPKTRPEFWNEKLQKNVMRDLANIDALEAVGWNVLIVWECQLKKDPQTLERLEQKLRLLSPSNRTDGNAAAPSSSTCFGRYLHAKPSE